MYSLTNGTEAVSISNLALSLVLQAIMRFSQVPQPINSGCLITDFWAGRSNLQNANTVILISSLWKIPKKERLQAAYWTLIYDKL